MGASFLALEMVKCLTEESRAMNKINRDHLTPEPKACLGRVYQFIIERGRRNRAMGARARKSTCSYMSEVDTGGRDTSEEQRSVSYDV